MQLRIQQLFESLKKIMSQFFNSRSSDVPEQSQSLFNLEKDENFKLFFPPVNQMVEESPEDKLECLMSVPEDEKNVLIKLEDSPIHDYYTFNAHEPINKTKSLEHYINAVKKLEEKCLLVQQIIFSTSQQPIYEYEIGFESDEDDIPPSLSKEEEFKKVYFAQHASEMYPNQVKLEEESFEKDQIEESRKFLTVISPNKKEKFDEQELSWIVSLTSSIYQNDLTFDEKKKFIAFLSKLESMKKLLIAKASSICRNDHSCKFCGEKYKSGRQLGGHISRKHPGFSFDYHVKKQKHKVKSFERIRRKFLTNKQQQLL